MRKQVRGADAVAAEVAARQHGVVTSGQLLAAGLSPSGITRRVRAGRLHRIHRGVYAVGHPGLSERGRWKAATLALGPGAVLSHRSAAELWQLLPVRGGIPHVTVPGPNDPGRRNGLRAHRSISLLGTTVTSRYGIPVTRPGQTIIDLARVEPPEVVRQARREAEFRNLPLDNLERSNRTRSDLEDEFLALVRRARLPEPEVGLKIGPYTVDFAWPAQRLVVETDGYRAHRGRQAFQDDRVRDAHLARLGFRVQRFSDWQIDHEPAEVIATVQALLGAGCGGR